MSKLFFVLFVFISNSAVANEGIVSPSSSIEVIDRAIGNGWEKLGYKISLSDLRLLVRSRQYSIEVVSEEILEDLPVEKESSYRRTGRSYRDGRIFLNEDVVHSYESDPLALGLIVLHEQLVVLDFGDANYEFTTAIALMATNKRTDQNSWLASGYLYRRDESGSSGTGVGGGGDLKDLLYKVSLYEEVFRRVLSGNDPDFRKGNPYKLNDYPYVFSWFVKMDFRLLRGSEAYIPAQSIYHGFQIGELAAQIPEEREQLIRKILYYLGTMSVY